jgi:hypothetical protein
MNESKKETDNHLWIQNRQTKTYTHVLFSDLKRNQIQSHYMKPNNTNKALMQL